MSHGRSQPLPYKVRVWLADLMKKHHAWKTMAAFVFEDEAKDWARKMSVSVVPGIEPLFAVFKGGRKLHVYRAGHLAETIEDPGIEKPT